MAGRATADRSQEAKGKAQQVKGKVQSTAGDIANDVDNAPSPRPSTRKTSTG